MPSLHEVVRGLGCCMAPPAPLKSSPNASDCHQQALATCKLGSPPTTAWTTTQKQQDPSTNGKSPLPREEPAVSMNGTKPGSAGQEQMGSCAPALALNGSHPAPQATPASEGHNCIATSASPFASSPFAAQVAAAASDQRGEGTQRSPLTSRGTLSAVGSAVSAEVLDAANQLGKLEQTLGHGGASGGAHGKGHKGSSRGGSRQDLVALGLTASGGLAGNTSSKGAVAGEGRESGGTHSRSSGTIRTSSNGEACVMRRGKSLGILQPMTTDQVSLLSILQPMTADQVCTHKSMCPGERVCVLVRDKSNGWGILQPGTADQARSRKEKNAIAAAAAAVTRATSLNAAQTPRDRSQVGHNQNRGISRTVASEADLQRLLNRGSPRSSISNDAAKVGGRASQLGRSSSSSSKLGGPTLVRRLMSMGRSETPSANGPASHNSSAGGGSQITPAAASSPSTGSTKGRVGSGGGTAGNRGPASKATGLRQAQSSGALLFPQASCGSLASLGSSSSNNMGGAALLLAASMEMLQGQMISGEMDQKEGQLHLSQSCTSLQSAQIQESSSSSTASGPKSNSIRDGSSLAPSSSFSSTVSMPTTPEGIARMFGEFFLKAMMTGDTKWGSHPELMSIFSDSAVLIGHDGQRYEGRAAIIRRLNTGMEQFLQMMGFREDVSEEARRDMAARASQVETSMEVSALPPSGKKGHHGRNGSISARPKPAQYSRGAVGNAGGGAGSMAVILVTYNFKAGFRRFKLQDRFKVRHGKITRLQRTRG